MTYDSENKEDVYHDKNPVVLFCRMHHAMRGVITYLNIKMLSTTVSVMFN